MTRPRIGVLALQGDVREHAAALQRCGAAPVSVRWAADLAGLDGLVVPGGESTTIGDLMQTFDLIEPIREQAAQGMPVYGTCAGCILLATDILSGPGYTRQPRLGLVPMTVQRNGFGRQRESFEDDLPVPALGAEPFRAVFIRAPYVAAVGDEVEVLATYAERIVAVRYRHFLATAFHPELTNDDRLHRYFIDMALATRKIGS